MFFSKWMFFAVPLITTGLEQPFSLLLKTPTPHIRVPVEPADRVLCFSLAHTHIHRYIKWLTNLSGKLKWNLSLLLSTFIPRHLVSVDGALLCVPIGTYSVSVLSIHIMPPLSHSTPIFLGCFNFPLSFMISHFCVRNTPDVRYLFHSLSYRIYRSEMHLHVGRTARQMESPRREGIRI